MFKAIAAFIRQSWQKYCAFTDRYFQGGQSCRRCVPQVNTETTEPEQAEPRNPSNAP